MTTRARRFALSNSATDLRSLLEILAILAATWLLLGWPIGRAISQSDGTIQWIPYTQHILDGFAWTDHLYRFGVVGGSKLHDAAGTPPILQLCALAGFTATTSANVLTIFLQLCFSFFGIKAIESLITVTTGRAQRLVAGERISAVWLCGFAPVLGWRLAVGHENLVFGLLPWVAGISLLWAARAGMLSVVALLFAAFAVANGVSAQGYQMIIYAALFGAPIVVATVFGAPRGARWGRAQWLATGAIVAGALVVLPRIAGMFAHALGEDFARSGGGALTYSYGSPAWGDWLASIAWSGPPTAGWGSGVTAHERNFPLGPLVIVLGLLAGRGISRRLLGAALASAILAILFANDVAPISSGLLAVVPKLDAFRVPARAVLPVLVLVPPFAMAAFLSTTRPEATRETRRGQWLGIVFAAALIVVGSRFDPWLREVLAWSACCAVAILARWRPAGRHLGAMLAIIAALGVLAFSDRLLRNVSFEAIEAGPRQLHDAVLSQAPDLAMPLNRMQIVDAPPPYVMSTALAARLPSLDGAWYPTRRFLALLEALSGARVASTAGVFTLTRSPAFPFLQQLYNVRYIVSVAGGGGSILELPPTPGPAWFVERVVTIDSPDEMALAMTAARQDLRAAIQHDAWILRHELDDVPKETAGCSESGVRSVTTDSLGQRAVIDVTMARREPCLMVVATNYATILRATARVGGEWRPVPVVPVDVALTGIVVPLNADRVELGPIPFRPWWAWSGSVLGLFGLLAITVATARGRPRSVDEAVDREPRASAG